MGISADVVRIPDPQKWGEVAANLMPFEPVIDGEVVTDLPIKRIVGGAGGNVDLLIGTNAEEQRLMMVPNGAVDAINDAILGGAVSAYGLRAARSLTLYREHRPGASAGDLLAAVIPDWFYRIQAIGVAEARATAPASTYMYEFAWRSPQFNGRLGACHAVELPFVFETTEDSANAGLLGTGAPKHLAETVHATWVAFAKSGNPGWAQYDLQHRPTMHFDVRSDGHVLGGAAFSRLRLPHAASVHPVDLTSLTDSSLCSLGGVHFTTSHHSYSSPDLAYRRTGMNHMVETSV